MLCSPSILTPPSHVQTLPKLLELYQTLRDLGHDHYVTKKEVKCYKHEDDVDNMVQELQTSVTNWKHIISELRANYTWLLYFSIPKLLLLHEIICSSLEGTEKLEKTIQEVSCLTVSQPPEGVMLRERVKVRCTTRFLYRYLSYFYIFHAFYREHLQIYMLIVLNLKMPHLRCS